MAQKFRYDNNHFKIVKSKDPGPDCLDSNPSTAAHKPCNTENAT